MRSDDLRGKGSTIPSLSELKCPAGSDSSQDLPRSGYLLTEGWVSVLKISKFLNVAEPLRSGQVAAEERFNCHRLEILRSGRFSVGPG